MEIVKEVCDDVSAIYSFISVVILFKKFHKLWEKEEKEFISKGVCLT